MWLLVMVLLTNFPGVDRVTVLETYPTWEDCRTERNRIAMEMAAAYPHDRDFVLECRPSGRRLRIA